ncbi:MAG: 2OG-Fe(II) oxygenase [Bacteriovoracaceae bacterium]|jgi:hypothetical protein|nr:2OG-Fe(II) oxygenase [Bacteriovoracaceae bacterium]
MSIVNLRTYKENLDRDSAIFKNCDPYPCITLDNFVDEKFLSGIGDEIRALASTKNSIFNPFIHYNAKVWGTIKRVGFSDRMNTIVDSFQTPEFMEYLENLTGVKNLIADKDVVTGGYVIHKKNGFVNLHVDHRTHPYEKKWDRKVLLLFYLNDNYKDEYKGGLEVWDEDAKERISLIAPLLNRCVIQEIDDGFIHGLPDKMNFPEGDCRKALVLWYFVERENEMPLRVTKYFPVPSDPFFKRMMILGENTLLYLHYVYKRLFGLDDGAYIKLQKLFRK